MKPYQAISTRTMLNYCSAKFESREMHDTVGKPASIDRTKENGKAQKINVGQIPNESDGNYSMRSTGLDLTLYWGLRLDCPADGCLA